MSRERDVDPVGACVGMKGSRVQSIIRELRGEKIDIIEHSDDLVTFCPERASPRHKITRVSVTHHGEEPHLDVIVEDEQLSLAIGKRGQNVRLASELISGKIDIKSETDVKDEVADALARMLQDAIAETPEPPSVGEAAGLVTGIDWSQAPGVDEETAKALHEAGFTNFDILVSSTIDGLQEVESIDAEKAQAILDWAIGIHGKPAEDTSLLLDEEGESTPALNDDEFMAALSKALRESEQPQYESPADDPFKVDSENEETGA